MMDIFKYIDYREYLRAFYEQKKQATPNFSYRSFARYAGLGAENYLKQVIDGTRSVTEKNINKFVKGLQLSRVEARYFNALVKLERALTIDEKEACLGEIALMKQEQLKQELGKDDYEIFTKWYAWAIRELVLLGRFKPDARYIAKKLKRRITPEQAGECFKKMLEKGFIVESDGGYKQGVRMITTSDEVGSANVRSVHRQMLEMAIKSLQEEPLSEREMSGLTIAVPKARFPEVKRKIKEFRKDLNRLLSDVREGEADEVIQLCTIAFKLTGGLK